MPISSALKITMAVQGKKDRNEFPFSSSANRRLRHGMASGHLSLLAPEKAFWPYSSLRRLLKTSAPRLALFTLARTYSTRFRLRTTRSRSLAAPSSLATNACFLKHRNITLPYSDTFLHFRTPTNSSLLFCAYGEFCLEATQ